VKLLTKELKRKLPEFSVERREPIAVVKFFESWSGREWYAAEYDPATRTFWGLVDCVDRKYGCFTLDELEFEARMPGGLQVERDKSFKPTPLKALE
jgi:hypothetical protein